MESVNDRFKHVKRIGAHSKWLQDFYHSILVSAWFSFFSLYVCSFVLFNLIFAMIYWLVPTTIEGTDGSLWHAFSFSVETFATIGYGEFYPKSDFGHFLVILEALISVFVTAVFTGLIFAKFSKPSARIIFSKNILINNFDGKRTMTFRMGNLRANQIAEAQVRMVALKTFTTAEKQSIRKQVDLKLVRDNSLFFTLTWSVMHIIDETSPLYNTSAEDFKDKNIDIGVAVTGYDSTFSQTIHANVIYSPEDIVFDKYFADVFDMRDGVVRSINYNKFHELKD
ncbi:MAG: ion channel [Pseudobdellovibrio sp.]